MKQILNLKIPNKNRTGCQCHKLLIGIEATSSLANVVDSDQTARRDQSDQGLECFNFMSNF